MSSIPTPVRILAFWHGFEFKTLFTEMFLSHPQFHVEIVSGANVDSRRHALSHTRLLRLLYRARRGDFDLILASNIYKSLWPLNKRLATRLANLLRFSTHHIHRTDTCWASLFASLTHLPLAVIDFRDAPFILTSDWPLLRHATLYFKRELFHWPLKSLLPLAEIINLERLRPYAQKLRPFTWGTPAFSLSHLPSSPTPIHQRDIDLFLSGSSNPIRQQLHQRALALAQKYPHLRILALDRFIPDDQYRSFIQRAKIVLCPESHACDNHRQYDVAAAGAVPAINWPITQSYLPFLPNYHAIYFSLLGDDFERTILSHLADLDTLQTIANNVRSFITSEKNRHLLAFHVVQCTLAQHRSSTN